MIKNIRNKHKLKDRASYHTDMLVMEGELVTEMSRRGSSHGEVGLPNI